MGDSRVLRDRRFIYSGWTVELLEQRSMLSSVPVVGGVPVLNSNVGASKTLYLDFDGSFESQWGAYSNITTPAYDQDGNTATFSDAELASIRTIWSIVSEDYAPFDINVTTVAPGSHVVGQDWKVVVGGTGSWYTSRPGGLTYTGSFTSGYSNNSFVFSGNLASGNARYTGDCISHEAGHAFGLSHQSTYNSSGALTNSYNPGTSALAPIMGNPYAASKGTWWYGTSASSSTFQDDLAVLANVIGYRTDDVGNGTSTATALTVQDIQVSGSGIIGRAGDVDYFSFATGAGTASFTVSVPTGINNLTAQLELRNSAGTVIATGTSNGSFGATLSTTVSAGTYFVVISSPGDYGDVGQYTVSGTVAPLVTPLAVGLGVYRSGTWFEDLNRNGAWDVTDLVATFGNSTDVPVIGDWNGDGDDEIGVFRDGQFYLDLNGDRTWSSGDCSFWFGTSGDTPLVGDWNGDGIDDIGVKRGDNWFLDLNGNRQWDGTSGSDAWFVFGNSSDMPVVGDWNGSGTAKIGVYRNGWFFLDTNGNRSWDLNDAVFQFGLSGDVPLVADWNADGIFDVGVKRGNQWYLDANGNRTWDGADRSMIFGNPGDTPLVGKWRVTSPSAGLSVMSLLSPDEGSDTSLTPPPTLAAMLSVPGCGCPACTESDLVRGQSTGASGAERSELRNRRWPAKNGSHQKGSDRSALQLSDTVGAYELWRAFVEPTTILF